ncbi:hypothetical protein AB0C12_13090 [Actinoplanes sp. NPDC048967]|uniref:hypothetical protein n=1 Tax=Actinoplanes sp. NPDC048967 TaxID=3155269 RepID=UPI00340A14F9
MNARTRLSGMVAAVALSGVLVTPGPAWAAAPPAQPAGPAAAPAHSADWSRTRLLASYDTRSTVRAAAWSALISSNVDAAVARFVLSGYPYAVRRSAETKVRNADFARRVLETHTAEFAPEVHAAARYALDGTAADLDYFARTGYAAAKDRDRQARESTGAQAAALVQADRDFVALLRDTAPGEQVRAAATFALRPAATDADLVEFFAYDWVNAAALDLDAFRIRVADEDMAWRAAAARLVAEARTAEEAALKTAGEAAEQARAAAARAWAAAGAQTGPARVAWAQTQQVAEAQAANWHQVAQAAGGATGVNWTAIAGSAGVTADSWAAEQVHAGEQAAHWAELFAQAVAGEQRMTGGAA